MSERRDCETNRAAGGQAGKGGGGELSVTLCDENGVFQVGEQRVPIVTLVAKEDQEPRGRTRRYSQPTLRPRQTAGTFTQPWSLPSSPYL